MKKIIFSLIVIELLLMGSGQLLKIDESITFRMLFFGFMLATSILSFFLIRRIDIKILRIFIAYLLIFTLAIFNGYIHNDISLLFIDIRTFSYLFAILFFYYLMSSNADVLLFVNLIMKVGFFMAFVYLIYILFFKLGFVDFVKFYNAMNSYTDFGFRGTSGYLFYKGFVFMPIALIFYIFKNGPFSKYCIIIILAIYYTETRGFWIMGVLSYLTYYIYVFIKNKYRININTIIVYFILLVSVIIYFYFNYKGLSGDRAEGDQLRIITLYQVIERTDFLSFIIGHGFGIGVPIRPVHMEMSFLEIFHKQGIIGLIFWLYLLYDSIRLYFRMPNPDPIYFGIMISIVLIYIQSLFNPYLTNPIGIGFVCISYIALNRALWKESVHDN